MLYMCMLCQPLIRGKTTLFCHVSWQQVLCFPPVMVYPRKTCVPDKLKEGAYPNTMFVSSESGWINAELFVKWFNFFSLS